MIKKQIIEETKSIEIKLKKHFRFMYSHFVILSQNELCELLKQNDNKIHVLKFIFFNLQIRLSK